MTVRLRRGTTGSIAAARGCLSCSVLPRAPDTLERLPRNDLGKIKSNAV